jgi:hypothetical protein
LEKLFVLQLQLGPLGQPRCSRVFQLVGQPGDFLTQRVDLSSIVLRFDCLLFAERGGHFVELPGDIGLESRGLVAAGGQSGLRALLQFAQRGG